MRPTGFPEWGQSAGSSQIVQPPLEMRARGWSGAQKPPAQHFNWLHALTHQNIKYLRYETVVDEDFCFARSEIDGGDGWTGLPRWEIFGPDAAAQGVALVSTGVGFLGAQGNPLGAVSLGAGLSGFVQVLTTVGNMSSRDFRFESYVKVARTPTTASGFAAWGFFGGIGVTAGATCLAGFVSTGPSCMIAFQWVPSGAQPTGINVNLSVGLPGIPHTGVTGYDYYGFGREDGNFTVQFNQTYSPIAVGPLALDSEALARLGAQVWGNRTGILQIFADKFTLGVRR